MSANAPSGPHPPEPAPADPEPPSRRAHAPRPPFRAAWPWVLGLVGLDYLSSLAYQPSVAFAAAGYLAPVVTVGVVAVTLLLAVPLYCYLAGRSPNGAGSTGLLERVVPGWVGKLLVLVLLGFAATDLVFTRTFSAADAAEHLIHSPLDPWQRALDDASTRGQALAGGLHPAVAGTAHGLANRGVAVTLVLLVAGSAIAWLFRRGVTRWLLRVAVAALAVYLGLVAVVVGSGLLYLHARPELVEAWWQRVVTGAWQPGAAARPDVGGWEIAAACVLLFPKLALGLSGFELTLTTMPLVRGRRSDTRGDPRGRVFNTRLMLVAAALLMAVFLLASTLVTTILIPADALAHDGPAANRALAYLGHGGPLADGATGVDVNPLFGPGFGAAYDGATVFVLTLAGVTVMTGMRDLIPPYLYRLGMDWKWSQRWGVLTYLFTVLKLGVTFAYDADPDAQRGAYLTGVLSVFAFASLAAVIDVWRRRRPGRWAPLRLSPLFALALVVFAGSLVVVVWARPDGLKMALWFVGLTLGVSLVTRFFRSTELRFRGFTFADAQSLTLWADLVARDYPILVPVRPDGHGLADKEVEIRKLHRLPPDLPVVFLKAEVGDASDFSHRPVVTVCRENGRVVADITGCASVPHVIAAAALEIAREGQIPEVHFGWSSERPLTANLNFVLFGQGNVPWMVYELIQAAPFPADRKPRVLIG